MSAIDTPPVPTAWTGFSYIPTNGFVCNMGLSLTTGQVAPGVVESSTRLDTIRGGAEVCVTYRNHPNRDSYSVADWAVIGTTPVGGRTKTNAVAGEFSGLVSPNSDYANFDVSIVAVPLFPSDAPSSRLQLGGLELETARGRVTISIERGLGARPDFLYAVGTVEIDAVTDPAVGLALLSENVASWTLRLMRFRDRVWGWVEEPGGTAYSVLNHKFTEELGEIRLVTRNLSNAQAAAMRWLDYRVEPAVVIHQRPLLNKTWRDPQLCGTIPPATLADVGAGEFAAFGLNGASVEAAGFTYTLPVGKTLTAARCITYEDAQVRDA